MLQGNNVIHFGLCLCHEKVVGDGGEGSVWSNNIKLTEDLQSWINRMHHISRGMGLSINLRKISNDVGYAQRDEITQVENGLMRLKLLNM